MSACPGALRVSVFPPLSNLPLSLPLFLSVCLQMVVYLQVIVPKLWGKVNQEIFETLRDSLLKNINILSKRPKVTPNFNNNLNRCA